MFQKIAMFVLVILFISPTVLCNYILYVSDVFKNDPTNLHVLGAFLFISDKKEKLNSMGLAMIIFFSLGIISSSINLIFYDENDAINISIINAEEFFKASISFSNETLKLSIVYLLTIIGINQKAYSSNISDEQT